MTMCHNSEPHTGARLILKKVARWCCMACSAVAQFLAFNSVKILWHRRRVEMSGP